MGRKKDAQWSPPICKPVEKFCVTSHTLHLYFRIWAKTCFFRLCDQSKHLFQFLQLSAKLVAAEFEPEISAEVHFEGEHTWQFFAADASQTILKGFWDVTCRNQMPTRSDDEILAHVVECIQMFLLVPWAPPMGWKRSVKHLVFGAHKANCDFLSEMQSFLQKKVVSKMTSVLNQRNFQQFKDAP